MKSAAGRTSAVAVWQFRTTLVAAILVLSIGVVYSNVLHAPFVLDDFSSVQNNRSIRHLWSWPLPGNGGTRGRPLANFSLALNYAWGGTQPAAYHLGNIAIHTLAALTLFGLIRRTLRLSSDWAARADVMAGATALLWAIHPLSTSAVTYISQRTEILMSLAYLLTLYAFVRAVTSERNRCAWQAASVLACASGMASKETMITAPFMVLLYDAAFVSDSLRAAWRARTGYYVSLTLTLMIFSWLMLGLGERGVGFGLGIEPLHYAMIECGVIVAYFRLAVWPTGLVFDHGDFASGAFVSTWTSMMVVGTMVIGGLVIRHFRPVIGFVLFWPLLVLAPTSSIVPVVLQPMAESRMYLPLAGVIFILVVLAERFCRTTQWFVALLFSFSVGLGVMAFTRNGIYTDAFTLWRDTVQKRPDNYRAHLNLATAALQSHHLDEARAAVALCLTRDPQNAKARVLLGLINEAEDRPADAEENFKAAARLDPKLAEAPYNLGCMLLKTGSAVEAARAFSRALQIDPDYGDAHNNMAVALTALGNRASALDHYSQALLADPRDPEIYANRADLYRELGQRAAALTDYQTALSLRPGFESVKRKLASLQSTAGH